MFRIGIKFSSNPHNRIIKINKYGYSRFYAATRCRDVQPWRRQAIEGQRDVRVIVAQARAGYSSGVPPSGKSGRKGILLLGSITLGTVGILALAKNNSDIRSQLEEWIPGTDKTIKVIFQEEGSYFDQVCEFFDNLKHSVIGGVFGDGKAKIEKRKDDNKAAPKPSFEPLVITKEPPVNDPYAEIRQSKDKGEKIQVVVEKPSPPKKQVPEELKPNNLVELEAFCGEAATKAITAYQEATNAIHQYNQDVVKVVEGGSGAPANIGAPIWQRLKEATEKRKSATQEAERSATEAIQNLKRLATIVDDPQFDAPSVVKAAARRNVKKIIDDVDAAKNKYDAEERSANITERYWNKVKTARENFNEELQILFPNINIHDKNFSVNEEAFDIFVLHMYNRVNYLQKELDKLESVDSARLKAALKSSGDLASEEKLNELVCREVNKEKRILTQEFEKKLLAERKSFEEEIRRQLKLQAQVNADHLKEVLEIKEKETQRLINRAASEQAEETSIKYKSQLAVIVGRLRGLDEALKLRLSEEKGACDAQMLWAACQALGRAIKVAPPGAPSDKPVRPLEAEINAVSKVAPKDDALVKATLEGIPEEAVKRGVFPEDALRERFLKVEHMARRLALVPAEGASLPIYLLSYLQSFLLVKAISPISKSELSDEPIDVSKLDTYDVLDRARYWLDRGDFKMTLKYMNLLKGASRSIARDWMNETRILLETQQAADTLMAYAGAIGLVFLGSGDSKNQN
ncbi:MICOS complex subunit Mic60 [Diachasma alloeum]|uniref:MICOS complex subunit Mic60 n=1 Tax=Diachasma alloeum TaxID=454923 RepID=UPI00073839D5|nr:MICOS complex subunit Mic60 [Diachasma alloeum]